VIRQVRDGAVDSDFFGVGASLRARKRKVFLQKVNVSKTASLNGHGTIRNSGRWPRTTLQRPAGEH